MLLFGLETYFHVPRRLPFRILVSVDHGQESCAQILTIFRNKSRLSLLRPIREQKKTMSKFIMSLGEDAYQVLQLEAKRRLISIQELLRAVIIPEWVDQYWDAQKALARYVTQPLIRS